MYHPPNRYSTRSEVANQCQLLAKTNVHQYHHYCVYPAEATPFGLFSASFFLWVDLALPSKETAKVVAEQSTTFIADFEIHHFLKKLLTSLGTQLILGKVQRKSDQKHFYAKSDQIKKPILSP